jgi:hypothetical protein
MAGASLLTIKVIALSAISTTAIGPFFLEHWNVLGNVEVSLLIVKRASLFFNHFEMMNSAKNTA